MMKKLKAMFKRRPSVAARALARNKELQEQMGIFEVALEKFRADNAVLKDNNRALHAANDRLQRGWNDANEMLLKEKSFLKVELARALDKLDEYNRSVTLQTYDENTARACLCQLRVMQMNVRGRTGYGVTAFIPNEVLERLRIDEAQRVPFRDAVFTALLERALGGMWHINSRGNISAILFAPKGSAKEGICGAVFDADTNPHVELARSKANDSVVRHIEQGIIDAQPENKAKLPREANADVDV